MASPKLYAEVWTRPGHASFGKVIADVPVISCSGTTVVNGIGEGRITIPKNYARVDEILKSDSATPANSRSSLVRVFSERSTIPIFEFIPIQFTGEQDKADPDIEISGPAIDSIWGHARLEAWDWTGADDEKSDFPDWIWGGRNILGELTAGYDPAVITVYTDADGGTFTLGFAVDGGGNVNTGAIAYNASAATVEAALEGLSNVVDVQVTGSGTVDSPWRIQTVDPQGSYVLSKGDGGLIDPWRVDVVGATGGTWSATVDGDTVTGLSRSISASALKTALEGLSTVTTCTVTSFLVGGDRFWIIYFDVPDTVTTFTVGDSLTPAGATVTVTRPAATVYHTTQSGGALVPQGWTASFNPVTNLPHGELTNFYVDDGSGTPALPACDTSGLMIAFSGIGDFPGVQKIVEVKPGGRYYGEVWVWANAAETYRFVIRDMYEEGIAADPGFTTGTTVTPNTWTQFFIPIVDIPEDTDRVIFRFASVNEAAPNPLTFIACMQLREGMPPDTWGEYLTQLFADATSDHAPGRVVWEAGTTNLPYLSLDFSPTLDSNGNAYTDPEVSITLKRGQNYLRVLSEAYKMGYEGRIVPDNVATGTWQLQFYNSQGMMVDYTLVSNGPSIQGGRDVTRRDLRRFMPSSTDVAVEGGGQNIARAQDSGAVTALGRIEAYQPNQDLGSLVEAATVADQSLAQSLSRSQSLTYILTPSYSDPQPFIDYRAGDTIYVLDPPDVPTRDARRIKSLQFIFTKDTVQYTVQLESESYAGVGPALTSSVDFLMKEFKAIRAQPPPPIDPLNYFQDPCCPGCPAQLHGYILDPIETSFYFVSWVKDWDPDNIVSVDAAGNVTFNEAGRYTYQVNYEVRWETTADAITQWRMLVRSINTDGPGGDHGVVAISDFSVDPTIFVMGNTFGWLHFNPANDWGFSFGWSLIKQLPPGVVDATTGNIAFVDLMLTRHDDGCARFQSSDA